MCRNRETAGIMEYFSAIRAKRACEISVVVELNKLSEYGASERYFKEAALYSIKAHTKL
jgi:hypothetical protein